MGIQDCLRAVLLEPETCRPGHKKPKPGEEVVITGMAGKFPDSDDVYHFRDNLFNKVDLVSGDCRRWKPIHPEVPQRTGKLNDIEKFDLGFFGVTKAQSGCMDPMVRLTLERVYETVVDAGYHPFDLENTRTGVYVGACSSETEKACFYTNNIANSHAITGIERSMISKHVAYFYKLNGPSFNADTACSSSLYALDHAYTDLREGRCDKAIVCGINMCLHPMASLQFARLGILSPDGCCKSFDDSGNGYARSEALGVLLLERSKDAKRIYAEVVHVKTNCDGYKEQGITFPSSEVQTALMKEFYNELKIDPATLTYVEAHGTGTQVGDPEELNTLDEIFCTGREKPLLIGTVKSNIGHSEPASGVCSIVKVLIGMEAGFIPPNIHFKVPRRGVEPLEKGRMLVVTERMPWPENKALAGINSFGFGGANGHVLLQWNTKEKSNRGQPKDNLPRLVCISGRTEYAVQNIINDLTNRQLDAEFIKLIHQVFRKQIPNQFFRGYTIINKEKELIRSITRLTSLQQRLCLVFTNTDQTWFQLGADLMTIPIFATAIQRIHDVLDKKLSLNITTILMSSNEEVYINQVLGTVAVQLGIAHLLKELNVKVDLMIGIGFGELLCGYLDQLLSMEEVILSAYYIALAFEKNSIGVDTRKLEEVLPRRALKPNRWIPVCTNNNEFNSSQSIAYLIDNILRPISLDDARTYIKAEDVVLTIGNTKTIGEGEQISLLDMDRKDATINLLDSLGMIYLKGIDMELDILYPRVSYPVSRGTPMLSPLVKWNHEKDCVVHLYKLEEDRKSGQKLIRVSRKGDDWGFVTGHVIDGRNLFPATGYLSIAWESYASMYGKLTSQMNIVFEDVRFLRAANVPTEGTLSLRVMIQLGNKYFEIIEGDTTLVSGYLYELNEIHTFAELPLPAIDETNLDERDVYKELKLRGYHYKDQFRAIKKCNFKGTNAIISWTGNWITFMDNMLQLQILQEDTRKLYLPTSIKRLVIDGTRHMECAHKYQNEVPVVCQNSLTLISGGGIEIRGLGASAIPRRKTAEPVLETYRFIPYEARLPEQDAVRSMVQIILENANVIKVRAVEMDTGKLFIPLVQQTLADLPLIQAELTILSKKQFDMPGVQIENKQLSSQSGCLLVLATDILSNNELLETALKATRETSGYIISYQSSITAITPSTNVKVLSSYDIQTGTLVLLQEAKQSLDKRPIEISCSDLSWIQPLKDSIRTNQRIVLHCKNSEPAGSRPAEPAGLLGFINCLRKEQNGSNISTVILMDEAPPFDTNGEFYKRQLDKDLAINIWKGGQWGSYRHLLMPQVQLGESEHCFVNVLTRGDLSSLRWIEGPLSKTTPIEEESELVDVYYSAINFRDVMTASGRIQADVITRDRIAQECVQGFEFSGRDSSGRRVMGMITSGAMSTMTVADKHLLIPVPPEWSLEDAATVPVVYGTVIYSLFMRGDMRRGQSILIHAGTGGVGQAAINIAVHHGCVIFTTVGTPEKKEFIKKHFPQIKEEHIGDSRSTSFEQMVLKCTNGRGVDFVLNSLAEEKLQASVRCLATKGIFLEIGKFDIASDNHIAVSLLKKQAHFHGIMLDHLLTGPNNVKDDISRAITEGIQSGAVKPLIRTTFEKDEIETAFRYMATGRHVGKVLIKVRDEENTTGSFKVPRTLYKGVPRFYCNPTSTYIILGGLGGFGLELADWLVVRGAKKLILTSRSGVKNGYQAFRLSIFKSYGATVIIRNDDAATEKGCEDLLKAAEALGPVDGIFNLAVVLQDGLFENQSEEAFGISLAPKATATRALDVASRVACPKLRYFVVFSSVSCGRGNAGQTNYGMANSVMERVCEMRKEAGYPALAIQWGAIGEVGLVAEMQENHVEMEIGGTLQQRIANCLQVMDKFLTQEETIVSSMVVAEKRVSSGVANITDAVLHILGVTNVKSISLHSTLPELGMDSIMAVELKQILETDYDICLAPQDLRALTLAKLKELVDDKTDPDAASVKEERAEEANLLVGHIGEETTANIPRVVLETLVLPRDEKAPHVFALPGIEGQAVIFQTLAKKLKFRMTCLQFCTSNHLETIEDIALSVLGEFDSTGEEVVILGYSMGSVIATQLAYFLEESGKSVRLIFIDGAPEYLRKIVLKLFPYGDDNTFQTMFLSDLLSKYIPHTTTQQHKMGMLNHDTFVKKMTYCSNLLTAEYKSHSVDYIVNCIHAAYARTKAILDYIPKMKLHSKVLLAKAGVTSASGNSEDFGLSRLFLKEVLVEEFDGDHVTILQNDSLAESINNFVMNT